MSPEALKAPITQTGGHCCSPQRAHGSGTVTSDAQERPRTEITPSSAELLHLPSGTFWLGSDDDRYPDDGESPSRPVRVEGFRIAAYTVSNDDFARSTAATGYVTTAGREGWSFVFGGCCPTTSPRPARWCRRHGGVRSTAPPGCTPRGRRPTSAAGPTTRSCRCPGSMPRPSAAGRGAGCRPATT